MSRSSKRFPYLNGYLQRAAEEQEAHSDNKAYGYGCLASGATFLVTVGLTARFLGFLAVPVALGASMLVGTLITQWSKRAIAGASPSERVRKAWAVAAELRKLRSGRKLHKWVDPTILQLLEASAFHWTRVHDALSRPAWADPNLPAHWANVREQAAEAAASAMADVLLLARSCIGPPDREKEDVLKEVLEDLVDLDIADALQGLKTLSKQDWADFRHQSPQAREVFAHAHPLAERLQSLADEVDRATAEAGRVTTPLPTTEASQTIDAVLGELRAIRQAESELERQLDQST